MSPFEHCARAMSEDELDQWGRTEPRKVGDKTLEYFALGMFE